ncbi:MAG TPA: NUDIX hydrolase [Syntrophobacteraceae bacterium]|nr:NUDIX hydrolase [Syntrophobacteraceae bacterium]
MPLIASRSVEFTTPWFDIVAKAVRIGDPLYYSLRMPDYVSIIALTREQELVLVRQYRPAVERYTIEFPSGTVEADETPEHSARRELEEETGYRADRMELLGALLSDTGRHENQLWCFLAPAVTPPGSNYTPEPGIERLLIHRNSLFDMIAQGKFDHALHLGALALALAKLGLDLFAGAKG